MPYYSSSVFLVSAVVFLVSSSGISGRDSRWESATATSTFNGQDLAGCGFENMTEYQGKTVAVSTAMYGNGRGCGACFEIRCTGSSNCSPGTIQVTAAASCSRSYFNITRDWCLPPRKHFELPTAVFSSIASDGWAVVPVEYRRVKCVRQGGMRFKVIGESGITGALVYNVAGEGDVVGLEMKGSESDEWVEMINGGDQRWVTPQRVILSGQSLSFRLTSSDGKVAECVNVAPKDWMFGETYEGCQF